MQPRAGSVAIPAVLSETRVVHWPGRTLEHRYEHALPPDGLTSNVRVACFQGDHLVIPIEVGHGPILFPGGTREPGEAIATTVDRELLEEVGARTSGFHPFGAVRFHSDAEEPFRPHLPHPDFYWIVGWADVEIVGAPSSPDDTEQIEAVELFASVDAIPSLGRPGWDWWAALLSLAVDVRAATRSART